LAVKINRTNRTKGAIMPDFTKIPLYYDISDYGVCIGTIVMLTEFYDESEEYDRTYEIVAYDENSGEYGIAEITDVSGEWMDWRPNYAIPLIWVWNYKKYAAI